MQLAVHRVFKIGTLTSLLCMGLMTYLSADNYLGQQSPSCVVDQLVADGRGTSERSDIPLKSNNQNASEVEEDDDDSAREFFSYLWYQLNESNFPFQTISLDYIPVQGEISTPPPRG